VAYEGIRRARSGAHGARSAGRICARGFAARATFHPAQEEIELPPMRVTTIEPTAKVEKPKQREAERQAELVVAMEAETRSPISDLQVPVEEAQRGRRMTIRISRQRSCPKGSGADLDHNAV
jgi:hypothetical protein